MISYRGETNFSSNRVSSILFLSSIFFQINIVKATIFHCAHFWRGGKGWNILFDPPHGGSMHPMNWLQFCQLAIARVQTSKKRGNDASANFGLGLSFRGSTSIARWWRNFFPRAAYLYARVTAPEENNRHDNTRSRGIESKTKLFILLF